MTDNHGQAFSRLPFRVAAITTVAVSALYLVVAVTFLAISHNNLVANIDGRLGQQLAAIQARPDLLQSALGGQSVDLDSDVDARRFDAPLVVWVTGPAGISYQSDARAVLPPELDQTAGPTTATIGGAQMRLVGGALNTANGPVWVTIAQTLGEVASAGNTLLVAELLTAPVLLLAVFIGALLVGRRVAGPIEQARVAQLAFTADASHELRTPLTVIEAETSLALQSRRDPKDDRQTLEHIQEEATQLRRLVDDLLWLARLDSAPSRPSAEPLDLGALALTTAGRFRAICDQRGTSLATAVTGSVSPVISAPPEWIARLVSVLVDNAIRHSPPGSAVRVSVTGDATRVQLAVEDNGPGIPIGERSRVLSRFHTGGSEREGAGLGLAIADAVVRSTGGHWEIGDAPAGGARMSVWWQRRQGKAFDSASAEQSDNGDEADPDPPQPTDESAALKA